MNNIEEIFNNAKQYHQNNKLDLAENLYKQILLIESNNHEVIHLLGVLYSQKKSYSEAIEYVKKAIEINNHPMYINNLAENYRRLGEFDQAILNFKKVIQIAPNFAEAYFNLANTLKQKGDFIEAENNYLEAIRINSNHFKAYFNLGNLLLDQKRFSQAVIYYQQTLKLNPDFIEATNNLKIANDFLEQENNKLTDINNTLDILGIAKTLMNQGNYDQAIKYYNRAKEIYPNEADIYNNLGFIFSKQNNWLEVINNFKKAIEVKPDFITAYYNLAKAYEKIGDINNSKKTYHDIYNFDPKKESIKFYADTIDAPISFNNDDIDNYQKELNNNLAQYINNDLKLDLYDLQQQNIKIPFSLIYQGREDLELRKRYADVFKKLAVKKTYQIKEKINIPNLGFIVTRGHEGIFTTCMKGLINRLSTDKFNITIICDEQAKIKIVMPSIKNPKIRYLDLPENINQSIEVITNAKFDLLYYWEVGTDPINYFLPFFRLAPIQCTSWGWPVSSGIPQMDYYISSKLMQHEESESQFSEKLVWIDSLLTYYFRTPLPNTFKPKSDFGFLEQDNIYICSQNIRKIHPDFDLITYEILKRDKNAVYVLFEDNDPNVTELLKNRLRVSHGEYFNRIRFVPRIMSGPDYINMVKIANVMLDTPYFCGVNTTYDAMVVGTPVVTLPSKSQKSRYSYAMYKKMNMDDCIAKSIEEYIYLSLKIANDKEYRQKISNKILEKEHVLFEDIKVVEQMSDLFESLLYS
ncbi:MAG: tetratricopeptide repeat protein [Candidatus Sericytochromatia bacterium]|nr:tetratricopeptide repeat protein [Candidatus Sericytochromatia bacterium]